MIGSQSQSQYFGAVAARPTRPMLSRTAENLFWIGRYMERAESQVRLLDMGRHMALLPAAQAGHRNEWRAIALSAGLTRSMLDDGVVDEEAVAHYLLFSEDNPSSVYNCIKSARTGARAVRTALSAEVWEALNGTWLEIAATRPEKTVESGLADFLDWVKERAALYRGAIDSTLLRTAGYNFQRLGAFLERADNTARLLDVKYGAIPSAGDMFGVADQYQWTAILRAVSSLRAYYWICREDYDPVKIAEFLILDGRSPRSLRYCLGGALQRLESLEHTYNSTFECAATAREIVDDFEQHTIAEIYQTGLHEFLLDVVARNNALVIEISDEFQFHV